MHRPTKGLKIAASPKILRGVNLIFQTSAASNNRLLQLPDTEYAKNTEGVNPIFQTSAASNNRLLQLPSKSRINKISHSAFEKAEWLIYKL